MIISKLKNIAIDLHFGIYDKVARESYIKGEHTKRKYTDSYICISSDQIVGALVITRSRTGKTIWSSGTIVRSSYRKNGIAQALWTQMLKTEKPRRIYVNVVSDRGYSLIESIRENFTKTRWFVSQGANRKLRRLKRK